MRATWELLRMYLILSMRVRIAFVLNVILPVALFVVYMSISLHQPDKAVGALIVRLVTLSALASGLFGLTINLVVLREKDVLRRFHLCPVSPLQIVGSRIAANYLVFIFIAAIELGVAREFLHVTVGMNALPTLLVFSLGYCAISALGFVIAGIVSTVQEAQIYSQILFIALLIFSGISLPLSSLPDALQHLAPVFPTSLMVVAADGVLVGYAGLLEYWREVLALVVVIAVMLSVSVFMFRWEKDQHVPRRNWLCAAASLLLLIAIGVWLNATPQFAEHVRGTDEHSTARLNGAPLPDTLRPAMRYLALPHPAIPRATLPQLARSEVVRERHL